jgi:hypothetical protein
MIPSHHPSNWGSWPSRIEVWASMHNQMKRAHAIKHTCDWCGRAYKYEAAYIKHKHSNCRSINSCPHCDTIVRRCRLAAHIHRCKERPRAIMEADPSPTVQIHQTPELEPVNPRVDGPWVQIKLDPVILIAEAIDSPAICCDQNSSPPAILAAEHHSPTISTSPCEHPDSTPGPDLCALQ